MANENDMFLLAVKNMIMDYNASSSSRNQEWEHQGHESECRDVSNQSHEFTQGQDAEVQGHPHQEVCERKQKKGAEKEKQVLLCKRNIKRNFVWRQCYKRNVKKLFSGRQCRPG